VQWWNAGRVLFFHPIHQQWAYTPPPHPGWPSAFTRPEAAEMLRWFFPAWAAGLAVRGGLRGNQGARWLLYGLLISSSLLALFGIIQQRSGTAAIYWLTPLDGTRFFASFGYENHGGSYFVLMSALSAGLLVDALLKLIPADSHGWSRLRAQLRHSPMPPYLRPRSSVLRPPSSVLGPRSSALLTLSLVLNLTAAHLALSRAGILLAWMLIAAGGVYVALRLVARLDLARRINATLAAVAVLMLAGTLAFALGGNAIRHELATLEKEIPATDNVGRPSLLLGDRFKLIKAAGQIWREAPWFGVGGWGYRYLLPYTQSAADWEWTKRAGYANVHNDPMQFLAEFGALGAGLLLIGAGALLWPLISVRRSSVISPQSSVLSPLSSALGPLSSFRRFISSPFRHLSSLFSPPPLVFFTLLGLALVWIHSLIDLPFRCPAILIAWVLIPSAVASSLTADFGPKTEDR